MPKKLADAVTRIALMIPVELVRRVNRWRGADPDVPSLSEAVRRLIEMGLDASEKAKAKDKKHKA
jgi:hypothetical protein